jgi:uncharacterized protein (DUF3820 family)
MYEYFFDVLFVGNNEYLLWYQRDMFFKIPSNTCDPSDEEMCDDQIVMACWSDPCEEYYRWLQRTNFYKRVDGFLYW